jgi:transposase
LKVNKQVAKLEQEEFPDKSLTELKIEEITAKLKYHQISDWEITQTNQGKTTVYRVKCKLRENQELIRQQQNSCGRFILATNILDTIKLESEEILKIYKEQQSTERGFRFIKDPLFFADSLFVKNPERVETMMMLMALCLLVYNLGQRQLRMSLKAQKATVKNQLNRPTESPTLRWIFQCFQGIHLLMTQGFQRILTLGIFLNILT